MEEIKNKILDVIRNHGRISINDLYREVGSKRNTVQIAYKEMVKSKILDESFEKNKTFLSIKDTNFDKYFENFDDHVQFDVDMAYREILALRQFKPVCKNLDKTKHIFTYWVNPKARPHIDMIIDRVNMIFARTASLTYAETMNLIPKKHSKQIRSHNEKCLNAVKEIIAKLMNEHKEYERAMKNIISYGLYGYRLISQLESISNYKNKSPRKIEFKL